MCETCDAWGIWVCCGGVFEQHERCASCGCTKIEDAKACELFEAEYPKRIARGDFPRDREMMKFKRSHGLGRVTS
jgi:hypothetical protein